MDQGEDTQPGESRCPDCNERWYSAAMLRDADATCPECGATLDTGAEPDGDAA